ncbi:linoleate 13S-lipoxygenase 3-1, chloroplastic [Tanacetum coccineum]
MSFEEAVGRLTAYEERIKSQDTLEANDQDKLLMASSNNKSYGKWRGKDFNKEGKDSMKWKNNPNARRASTSQGTKDKSNLRCYECEQGFTPGRYCMEISDAAYKHWRFDLEGLPADLIRRVNGSSRPETKTLNEASQSKTTHKLYLRHENWWPTLANAEDLTAILTTIIWLASAQHAALNFGQYPYGGYIPNRPPRMRSLIPDENDPEYASFLEDPQNYFYWRAKGYWPYELLAPSSERGDNIPWDSQIVNRFEPLRWIRALWVRPKDLHVDIFEQSFESMLD